MSKGYKIVHNKLLGWVAVTGPHHFPLSSPHPTRAGVIAEMAAKAAARDANSFAARKAKADADIAEAWATRGWRGL